MELFHDPKIDWLGKKWYFLGFSLIFSVAGLLSMRDIVRCWSTVALAERV